MLGEPDVDADEAEQVDEGGINLITMRTLSTQAKEDLNDKQRDNIFHTQCQKQGKTCSLIMDDGSCTNVASNTLFEKLNLPTLANSKPYRLQWLNNSVMLGSPSKYRPFKIGGTQIKSCVMRFQCKLATFFGDDRGNLTDGYHMMESPTNTPSILVVGRSH